MSKESILNLESLFHQISHDWFVENNFPYESARRSGIFSAALTIWLMILQRLTGMPLQASIVSILNDSSDGIFIKLNKKSKKLSFRNISTNSGGFSRARDRIELESIIGLAKHCEAKLRKKQNSEEKLYLLDGMCVTTAYSAKNEKAYPRYCSTGKDRKMHYPRVRLLTAHNLSNGIALPPIHGSMKDGETALAWRYLNAFPQGSTVMGDRNFGNFSVAYKANSLGHKVIFRMNEHIFKAAAGAENKDFDKVLEWKPSRLVLKTTPEIPQDACIKGRFIKITVNTPGFRPQTLYFFSTAPGAAEEIATTYLQRLRVETHIHQLKQILKLEFVSAKTPERIQKELAIAFLTFNLISSIMAAAAKHNNIPFSRISFTATIRIISAFAPRFLKTQNSEQRLDIINKIYIAFNQTKLPLRKKQRSYPRVVKRKASKYPSKALVEDNKLDNKSDNQILNRDSK